MMFCQLTECVGRADDETFDFNSWIISYRRPTSI